MTQFIACKISASSLYVHIKWTNIWPWYRWSQSWLSVVITATWEPLIWNSPRNARTLETEGVQWAPLRYVLPNTKELGRNQSYRMSKTEENLEAPIPVSQGREWNWSRDRPDVHNHSSSEIVTVNICLWWRRTVLQKAQVQVALLKQ